VKEETDTTFYACEQKETIGIVRLPFVIDQQVVFTHVLQDPFAACLQSVSKLKFSDLISVKIDFKLLDDFL